MVGERRVDEFCRKDDASHLQLSHASDRNFCRLSNRQLQNPGPRDGQQYGGRPDMKNLNHSKYGDMGQHDAHDHHGSDQRKDEMRRGDA